MSSILDALEKLERSRPPTIEPVPVVVPPPRRTRAIVLAGSAFAAGAVLALGLLRGRPAVAPQAVPLPARIQLTRSYCLFHESEPSDKTRADRGN